MTNNCIMAFCQNMALKWNFVRITGAAEDRAHFFFNEAKNIKQMDCIPEVTQLCNILIEYKSKADWIFDQYFWMFLKSANSPDCHPVDNNFQQTMLGMQNTGRKANAKKTVRKKRIKPKRRK